MQSMNPYNNEIIAEYNEYYDKEVDDILEKSQKAWESWRTTDFSYRKKLMLKAAENLRSKKEEYARMMSLEMGKIITEARAEVEKSAWVCEFYAENAEKFLADEEVETDASRSFVSYEPIGLVLAVMPWNFPFWQVFRFAAPALMAGNGGILKHASNVPGSALAIERVFREAGFPEDLFRTLLIGASKVKRVIHDKRIKAVTLTGSEPAGMVVAAEAGKALKKTVLELGGSDPFIVLDDADIPACVLVSAQARMMNAGQSCIAAKRFIVVASRVKEFEEAQTAIMAGMKMGDPLDEKSQVGPIARADLRDELHDQVQRSVQAGARLLTGGVIPEGSGAFYLPTVVTDIKKGMSLYHEETFGPVSAIIAVKDEEEAIRVANDSDFGLGASLWSRDLKKAEKLARRIESGAVFINGMTKSDPRLPFGGVKRSGYGRELSYHGIREFVNIKSIWLA